MTAPTHAPFGAPERDWRTPTNAVPGMEEYHARRMAEQASRPAQPAQPVFTIEGFGRSVPLLHVPDRVYTVPGVGEDFNDPAFFSGRRTGMSGTDHTAGQTGRASQAVTPNGQATAGRLTMLQRLALQIQIQANNLVESACRAGRATRDLCRGHLFARCAQIAPLPTVRQEQAPAARPAQDPLLTVTPTATPRA